MFYERIQGNDVYNMGPNPPFGYSPNLSSVSLSNPNVSVITGQAATVPSYPASITALAFNNYQPPTSAQWNFGIQHQISQGSVVSVAYVGNADYHQRDEREINDLALSDPNRAGVIAGTYIANFDRPYLGYSNILLGESASNTHYESLQFNYRIDNWRGFDVPGILHLVSQPGHRAGRRWRFQYAVRSLQPLLRLWPDRPRPASNLGAQLHLRISVFKDATGLVNGTLLGGWTLSGITLV